MKVQRFRDAICILAAAAMATLGACRSQPRDLDPRRPDWTVHESLKDLRIALDVWEPVGTSPDNRWFRLTAEPRGGRPAVSIDCPYDGKITGHWIADLDGNSLPEVILFETGLGTGAYGTVRVYEWTGKQFLASDTTAWKTRSAGYMGHDSLNVGAREIRRDYPVYRDNDANCCPSGGVMTQTLRLAEGRLVLISASARAP